MEGYVMELHILHVLHVNEGEEEEEEDMEKEMESLLLHW